MDTTKEITRDSSNISHGCLLPVNKQVCNLMTRTIRDIETLTTLLEHSRQSLSRTVLLFTEEYEGLSPQIKCELSKRRSLMEMLMVMIERITSLIESCMSHEQKESDDENGERLVYQSRIATDPIDSDEKLESIVAWALPRTAVEDDVRFDLVYQSGIATDPVPFKDSETVGEDISKVKSDFTVNSVVVNDTVGVPSFDLDSIFNRDYLYPNNLTWTTSAQRFELIEDWALPRSFIELPKQSTYGTLQYHALYKSNFRVTIRTDATNYNQGMLCLFAVPGGSTSYDTFSAINKASVLNYPHVFFKVGTENEFSLDVPYGNIFSMIPSNHRDYVSSNVYLMVWSPLRAGTSAPSSLSLSVWFRPLDTYLGVKTASLVGQSMVSSALTSMVLPAAHYLLDKFDPDIAKGIKAVGKRFGIYDRVGRDADTFDCARCTDEPVRIVNTKINQLEFIPNVEYRFEQKKITDLVELARIPSLAASVSWDTSALAGRSLIEFVVSPTSPMIADGATGAGYVPYLTTNIAFVASMMKFYRGSIDMMVQIVGTSFHRGTLFIAFDPYGTGDITYDQACGLPGISVPISASTNTFTVRIPYTKHKDYVQTQFPNPDVDNQLGRVYVFVQNSLVAPVSVPNSVDILFYFSAGSDAEFRYPIPFSQRGVLHEVEGLVFQSNDKMDDIVSFYKKDLVNNGFIGGPHTNILGLLRRPEYLGQYTIPSAAAATFSLTGPRVFTPWHKILTSLFKYNSGGIIVHFLTDINKLQSAIQWFTFEFDGNQGADVALGGAINNNDVWEGAMHQVMSDPATNFLVPGYNEIPFHYGSPYSSSRVPLVDQQWLTNIQTQNYTSLINHVNVAHSVADDFMLYLPMSVPRIAITADLALDGVIPKMTSATVDGFNVTGPGVTNLLNIFDRNLAAAGSLSGTGLTLITVNFPITNTFYIERLFLSVSGSVPAGVTFRASFIAYMQGGAQQTLKTFNSIEEMNGFSEIVTSQWYDGYGLSIEKSDSSPWNLLIYAMQLEEVETTIFAPRMISNTSPAPYVCTASSGTNGWQAYDGSVDTIWQPSAAGAQSVYLAGTSVVPIGCRVTGKPLSTTGYTSWTLWGARTSDINPVWIQLYTTTTESLVGPTQVTRVVQFRNLDNMLQLRFQGNIFTGSGGVAEVSWILPPGNAIMSQGSDITPDLSNEIPHILIAQGDDELDNTPLTAQGALDYIKNGFHALLSLKSEIKRSCESIRGVNDASDGVRKFAKFFKSIISFIREISIIVTSLHTIITAPNTALASCAIVNITSSVLLLSSSNQQQSELIPQADCSQFTKFVDMIKGYSLEAADMVREYLDPSRFIRVISHMFEKFGYKTLFINNIFDRELIKADGNIIVSFMRTIASAFFEGETYGVTADAMLGKRVTAALNEVQELDDKFDYYTDFNFEGKSLKPLDLLPHIRKAIYEMRTDSAFTKPTRYGADISNLNKLLASVETKCRTMKHLSNRYEPVTIYLTGDSGCGKTLLTTTILPILMNNRLENVAPYEYVDFGKYSFGESSHLLVHSYIPSDTLPYDSLYNHQNFFIVDDIFTDKDGHDGTFLTKLINIAPLEVAKADVNSKGSIYKVPFCFITSNEQDPVNRATTMNSATKLLRRLGKMIHIGFRVAMDPQARAKQLANLLPTESEIEGLSGREVEELICNKIDSIYTFQEKVYPTGTSSTNLVDGRRMQFKEILDHLQQKFIKNTTFIRPVLDRIAGLKAQGDDYDDFSLASDSEETLSTVSVDDIDNLIISLSDEDVPDEVIAHARTFMDDILWLNNNRVVVRDHIATTSLPDRIKSALGVAFVAAKTRVLTAWRGAIHFIKMHPVLTGAVGALSVVGIGLIYKAVMKMTSGMGCLFQNLVYDNKAVRESVKHLDRSRIIPQGYTIGQSDEEKIAKIRKNVVSLRWGEGEFSSSTMHALFLNAKTLLINRHFFDNEAEHIAMGHRPSASQPGLGKGDLMKWRVLSIPRDQRIMFGDNIDLVMCELSVTWPNVRDITSFIVRTPVKNRECLILGKMIGDDIFCQWDGTVVTNTMGDKQIDTAWIDFCEIDGVKQVTERGHCGRPYYILGVGLVGIHSAISPTSNRGAATLFPAFSIEKQPERDVEFEGTETSSKFWFAETPIYAQAKINGITQQQFVGKDTALVKIEPELVTLEECPYAPSQKTNIMVNNVPVSPLITGSQKWYTDQRSGVPRRTLQAFSTYFNSKMPLRDGARPLTVHESINGFDQMDGIRMKTSAGIWNKYFSKGKRDIFVPIQQDNKGTQMDKTKYQFGPLAYDKIPEFGQSFVSILQRKEDQLQNGKIPEFVFLSTLKDELKHVDKIAIGKTRVFEQSSLDYVLLNRKYFGMFVNDYRKNAGFTLYHGIGRDKDGVWPQYANTLTDNSHLGHCFDYKNFDGSLPPECFTFFKMVTDLYYSQTSPTDKLVRHGLIDAMQNGIHLSGNLVFESSQGNKSGNAFTDVFNSISNTYLMWLAFCSFQVGQLEKPLDVSKFDKHIKMLTYGDDVVMTIKQPLLLAGFNGPYIQRVMSELGMTITSANKKDAIEDFLPFEDLTFLKSPFVYDEKHRIWRAPLPIQDILKELRYRPKSTLYDVQDLEQRVMNVQRFLVHHPESVFNEWVSKLKERGAPISAMDYSALSSDLLLKQIAETQLY